MDHHVRRFSLKITRFALNRVDTSLFATRIPVLFFLSFPPLVSVGEQLRGVFDVQVLFVVLVLRSSLLPLRRVYRFATFRPVLGTRLARRAEIPRPLPLLCLRHVRHQPFHSLQLSLLSR